MYINGKLVDSLPLSLHKIDDAIERKLYLHGAIHHMMEPWEDLIAEEGLKPEFFIRSSGLDSHHDSLLSSNRSNW